MQAVERRIVNDALDHCPSVRTTALYLGISVRTLYYKKRYLGLTYIQAGTKLHERNYATTGSKRRRKGDIPARLRSA